MIDLTAAPYIADTVPGDAIIERLPFRHITSLAAYEHTATALHDAILARFGLSLPAGPHAVTAGRLTLSWAGPQTWLLLSSAVLPSFADLAPLAAVTALGDSREFLRVSGPHARDALAKLVPLDLHHAVFPRNATALTLAGHVNIQIWHTGLEDFELCCYRSFGDSLFHALVTAAREFA